MISVCKTFSFEYAHYLPCHQGKCRRLHGHSAKLEIEVTGAVKPFDTGDPESGMVIDFGNLKAIVQKNVIDVLDHSCLNDIFHNPTAEVILQWIRDRLITFFKSKNLSLSRIRLYETQDSYVEWKNGGYECLSSVELEYVESSK